VELSMETDHNHACKFCAKTAYKSKIKNIATAQTFKVIPDKFNVGIICT